MKTSQQLLMRVLRKTLGTITRVKTEAKLVAFTFDDGPHPTFTPLLLEILARYNAQATFFMLGERASRYPELVRLVANAGHTIGNHSWNHPSFPGLSHQERLLQMRQCAKALAPYSEPLFRPPFGHQNIASRMDAWYLKQHVVTWNVIAHDWLDDSATQLTERVTAKMQPGAIVLWHDALAREKENQVSNRQATLDAVQNLLETWHESFRFVTVPELMRHGEAVKKVWTMAAPPDTTQNAAAVEDAEAREAFWIKKNRSLWR
jgi:peptidoglycan/xylan/chitin deacetylase (PgdA/CDA1 family)